MIKIDRDRPAEPKRALGKYEVAFSEMKPGDSFYFEGVTPQTVGSLFGIWLRKGRYSIRKDGEGYRFYLLK